jgi:large subunit ribosomal protein L22
MAIRAHNLDPKVTAQAAARSIKGSVQKVGLVCNLIKGLNVNEAMLQLQFSKKRTAKEISEVLKSAIANAENNQSLDIDNLFVSQILVGKALTLKRFHARGRGRAASIIKPYSKITIFVSERV